MLRLLRREKMIYLLNFHVIGISNKTIPITVCVYMIFLLMKLL